MSRFLMRCAARPHRFTALAFAGLIASPLYVGSRPAAWAQGDEDIADLFGTAAACELTRPLQADMPVQPLYVQGASGCEATVARDGVAQRYLDANCATPVAFSATSLLDYCRLMSDDVALGNGAAIADEAAWTLLPGNRLDMGARTLEGVGQPYLQRRVFREIDTASGQCQLEMRVYSAHPAGSGQRALVAWHGGSWSQRAFGSLGLDLTVPHFVAQGFVVFAPYYRLLDEKAGGPACNRAALEDLVIDAEAALGWVEANAQDYGASGQPVLFGQSAGGHLAARISVDHPERVSGAVLFYPPVDFTDFVLRARRGAYTDEQGLGLLEALIGSAPAEADINREPVPSNSLPQRVLSDPAAFPPMFMVYGGADTLVEVRQGARLCGALGGRIEPESDQPLAAIESLRVIRNCGTDSNLHLVREGGHALDLCFGDIPLLRTPACLSGSEESRNRVADSIGQAALFAAAAAAAGADDGDEQGGGGGSFEPAGNDQDRSGSGGVEWLFMFSVSGVVVARLRSTLIVRSLLNAFRDQPEGDHRA